MRIKKQEDRIREYSTEIGLVSDLIHAPRTITQADGLLNMQNSLIKHDAKFYSELNRNTELINDPGRDLTFTLDKIQAIEDYILKYHDPSLYWSEIKNLHSLANKIQDSYRYLPSMLVADVLKAVVIELTELGFSDNMITKGPKNNYALKSVFKSILTGTHAEIYPH